MPYAGDPDWPGYAPGPGDSPLDPDYLRTRVREEPSDWRRWLQLGSRLLDLCEDVRAREAMEEAVRLNADNGLAHRLLALALSRTGARRTEVLRAAERTVQLRPHDGRAWGIVAVNAEAEGDLTRALRAWRHVARLSADPEVYWNIARCLQGLGRSREAVVALEEAVRRKPNHLPALRLLYLTARSVGEEDTARAALAALFQHNPVRARELMEGYRSCPRIRSGPE